MQGFYDYRPSFLINYEAVDLVYRYKTYQPYIQKLEAKELLRGSSLYPHKAERYFTKLSKWDRIIVKYQPNHMLDKLYISVWKFFDIADTVNSTILKKQYIQPFHNRVKQIDHPLNQVEFEEAARSFFTDNYVS